MFGRIVCFVFGLSLSHKLRVSIKYFCYIDSRLLRDENYSFKPVILSAGRWYQLDLSKSHHALFAKTAIKIDSNGTWLSINLNLSSEWRGRSVCELRGRFSIFWTRTLILLKPQGRYLDWKRLTYKCRSSKFRMKGWKESAHARIQGRTSNVCFLWFCWDRGVLVQKSETAEENDNSQETLCRM